MAKIFINDVYQDVQELQSTVSSNTTNSIFFPKTALRVVIQRKRKIYFDFHFYFWSVFLTHCLYITYMANIVQLPILSKLVSRAKSRET